MKWICGPLQSRLGLIYIFCHRTCQLIAQVDQRPLNYHCKLITNTYIEIVPVILVQIFLHGHVASYDTVIQQTMFDLRVAMMEDEECIQNFDV